MAGVNKTITVGNLARDPEVRQTQGGKAVCNLVVATSYKPQNGEEQKEFHRVTVWGNQADACGRYLKKGRQVYVEGRLQTRKYTDKQGVERYATEIVAERVQFLGGKPKGDGFVDQVKGARDRAAQADDHWGGDSIPF